MTRRQRGTAAPRLVGPGQPITVQGLRAVLDDPALSFAAKGDPAG